jgi:hypothetical protein
MAQLPQLEVVILPLVLGEDYHVAQNHVASRPRCRASDACSIVLTLASSIRVYRVWVALMVKQHLGLAFLKNIPDLVGS